MKEGMIKIESERERERERDSRIIILFGV